MRRNDGDYAYNLAVTVDDGDQGITEVVRGADLLETTGRQLWLYDKLALTAPSSWVHAPLMLGDDGARLAKRHGAVTLEEQLDLGRTADQVRAELLSSVGLELPDPSSLRSAVASFDWEKLSGPGRGSWGNDSTSAPAVK